jgi:uncharacterized protein with HEPN domain
VPPRDSRLRLQDIVQAIDRILTYTNSLTFESFLADQLRIDAVIRNFEIIGEAARHVDDDTCARCPDVPWQDMRDMRNLLLHEYFGVSIRIVWDTIQRDLPSVSKALTAELARAVAEG